MPANGDSRSRRSRRQPQPQAAAGQSAAQPAAATRRRRTGCAAGGEEGRRGRGLNINDLKDKSIQQLTQIAKDLNVAGATGMRKQELIFQILKAQTEQSGFIFSEGVLEVLPDGFGFLRAPEYNYLPGPGRHLRLAVADPQVRPADRRHCVGPDRPPKEGERYFALIKVEAVNFESPDQARDKLFFENLTPLYPQERFMLETTPDNLSAA